MRLKAQIYFTFLGVALLLFALGAMLTRHAAGDVRLGLLRFIALFLAVASSIGAWGTAVAISSVHKVTWPLYVTVILVVLARAVFAIVTYPGAGSAG